jgi:hypothetical protein
VIAITVLASFLAFGLVWWFIHRARVLRDVAGTRQSDLISELFPDLDQEDEIHAAGDDALTEGVLAAIARDDDV